METNRPLVCYEPTNNGSSARIFEYCIAAGFGFYSGTCKKRIRTVHAHSTEGEHKIRFTNLLGTHKEYHTWRDLRLHQVADPTEIIDLYPKVGEWKADDIHREDYVVVGVITGVHVGSNRRFHHSRSAWKPTNPNNEQRATLALAVYKLGRAWTDPFNVKPRPVWYGGRYASKWVDGIEWVWED